MSELHAAPSSLEDRFSRELNLQTARVVFSVFKRFDLDPAIIRVYLCMVHIYGFLNWALDANVVFIDISVKVWNHMQPSTLFRRLQLKMKIVGPPKLGSMLPLKLEPKKEAPLPANNRITALGHTWEDSKIIVIPLTFRFIYAPEHMASAAPSMVSWQPFQALVAPGCLRCSGNLQRSWGRRLGWQEHLQGRERWQPWNFAMCSFQCLVSILLVGWLVS